MKLDDLSHQQTLKEIKLSGPSSTGQAHYSLQHRFPPPLGFSAMRRLQFVCLHLKCHFHSLFLLNCRALKFLGPGGPPHVKLVIEWEHKTKEW